ncbi:MAG: NUDIX domain-containing protein [Myxococcales bacterium]|nr:NUDIX domain-containing protein [Myxococcales bacterium]
MSELRVAEVDEHNRFVRWVTRAVCHAERLPHRSVQILLYDRAGRLVLQRRHPDKRTWPDAWDASASGHVEEPDYPDPARPDDHLDAICDAVAHRELMEELGVRADLERLGTFAPEPGVHYEHFVLYRGVADGPYVPQPEEVAEVRVFDERELAAFLASDARRTRSLEWLLERFGPAR